MKCKALVKSFARIKTVPFPNPTQCKRQNGETCISVPNKPWLLRALQALQVILIHTKSWEILVKQQLRVPSGETLERWGVLRGLLLPVLIHCADVHSTLTVH